MVTIKDVARESKVAISTVSNVLNNVDNVSEETKIRVLAAVEKLKYVPNVNAKYLKSKKKNTVGLFLSSIQGDFYKTLMQAIHLQCKMNGFMLNIYISNENTSEEIYGMVISSGVEGAIIMNESLGNEYIDRITPTNLPIVFIDREFENESMSSVIIDNFTGSVSGMEYLVKLGHRKIGYFHGAPSLDDRERFRAYNYVMNKYNLPINEKVIVKGYFEEAIAYSEMYKLLLKGIELPDAFFCANDEMAQGCMRAMTAMGIRVPEQVSVLGFDDSTLAPFYTPALTTIHSPVVELGSISASEIIRLIRKEGLLEGCSKKLEPTLVTRNSCVLKM